MMSACMMMLQAQTLVTVGTGTNDEYSPSPFCHYYEDGWSETIYPASEIGISGMIVSIAYQVADPYPVSCSTLKIYMGTKSQTTHSDDEDWLPMSALTLVYEATNTTIGSTAGWQTFQLSTPFYYDGIDNLVVAIGRTSSEYNSDLTFYYTEGPSSVMLYRETDGDASYGQHPGTAWGDLASNRFNIQLGINTGPITCPSPSVPGIADVDATSATLFWSPGGTESSWDIVLNTTGIAPDSTSVPDFSVTDTFYNFQNLNASTHYYAYVRANCGAGEYSFWRILDFYTLQIPATLPYSQDWEDGAENAQWTIDNSGGTNKWYVGSAANCTAGGDSSLYISNTNGSTNSYDISSSSAVWAYRDVDFDNYVEYNLSCDVRCNGENNYDYMQVFVGPPATPAGTSAPAGAVQAGSDIVLLSDFTHVSVNLPSTFSGLQRVYFLWRNDGSVGNMPPAAVDNITITGSNCGSPYALAADSITTNSIVFHFTPASASDGSWEAVIVPDGSQIDETQVVTLADTMYEFTGLNANTMYNIFVRTDCGGVYSNWSLSLSVRTACDLVSSLPFTENFDTYGTGTGHYPTCWTKINTYSSDRPYVSTTKYEGVGSLYFYAGSTNTYNIAILPEFDSSIPVNSLQISFMYRASNASDRLIVGVMDNPLTATSFVPVDTVYPASPVSTWVLREVSLASYTGTGQYIAFKNEYTTTTGYAYIDNLLIETIPSCLRPVDVTVSNVTASSAVVDWTPRNDETMWQVVVVPNGSTPDQGIVEYAYEHPYTISNLNDNTQYVAYVKSDCGGDESSWTSSTSFYTLCLPNNVFPYIENFNSYGTGSQANFPNCWSRYQTGTTTLYPYISSTGGGSLYFYGYSSISDYGVTQAQDLSNETPGTMELSFDLYKTSVSYGRMDIGYMTVPGDMSTFHVMKSIYPGDLPNNSTWYPFAVTVPAGAYLPEVYFAFSVSTSSSTNYVYLDNVRLDYLPTCSAPSNLAVTSVSGNSALLTWDEAPYGVSDYTVEYMETGTGNWQSQVVTGDHLMLAGLTELTSYDVMLYGNCGAEYSDTLTTSFTTDCMAGGSQIVGDGTLTNYHIPLNTYYNYSYVQELYLANEINASGNINSISFQYIYSTPQTKTNQSIYLAETDLNTLSDWIPFDSLTLVYNGSITYTNSGPDNWMTIDFATPFNYSGNRNLVVVVKNDHGAYTTSNNNTFKAHAASGKTLEYYDDDDVFSFTAPDASSTYAYRNNIKFGMDCDQTVTCIAPNVYVDSYDATSATIAWVPGASESSWEMEYKSEGDAAWTSVGTVTSSPYELTNLSSNATYTVRLRSDCGGDNSTWATTSFTIPCYVAALPFVEDFSTATGSGSSHTVPCWSKKTNYSTAYPYPSSSQSHSSPYSLYFYGSSSYYSLAATPRFDDSIEMDSLNITFWSYKTSANYFIEVGIMSDPDNPATFEPIGSFSPSANSTWERAELNTRGYSGNGRYVAFRVPQWISNYQYLDDVTIDYIPACLHVENLTASNITAYAADVIWSPGGAEDTWEVLYGENVNLETDIPTMVYDTLFSLSGLTPNTLYHVYVRGICSGDDQSAWESMDFRTDCVAIDSLPYVENFDTYGTGENAYPFCWGKINTYSSNRPYINATHYAGVGSLYFYAGSSNTYNIAVMPEIDASIPVNTLQATFMYRTTYATDRLVVGVMTDPTDASTFVAVDTVYPGSSVASWVEREVFFSSYAGAGHYIAFKNAYNSTACYGYVDNLVVDLMPSCPKPSHLNATATTANSVTLDWAPNGSETSWTVAYGTQGFDPNGAGASTVTASTHPFTVDNLASATSYEFYVQANCGSGDDSYWTGPVLATPGSYNMPATGNNSVTTCAMVIYDDGGPNGNYSNSSDSYLTIYPETPGNLVSLQGTSTTESNWDYLYIYDGAGTGGTLLGTYSGEGLTVPQLTSTTGPLTIYFHSDGSVPKAGWALTVSCISNTCPAPTNLTVSNIGNTSATVSWTPVGSETSWIVEHKTAAATNWTVATATSPTYDLTGLTALTAYQVRVKADCGGETSPYKSTSFTTSNCAAGDACPYMFVLGDGYGDGWNDGYLTIMQGGVAVAVLEAVDHQLEEVQTYDTVMIALCDNQTTTLNWSEGDYDDEISIKVMGPDGTQVFYQYDLSTTSGTLYTFTTDCSNAPVTCNVPTGLAVNNPGQTTATATWTAGGTETSWNVQYKAASASTWQSATANTTSYTMTGLTPSTAYQVKVQANCGSGNTSDWTTAVSFTTANEDTPTCPAPTGLTATVDHTDVTLTWQQEPNTATEWQINYRLATESTWSTVTATTTTYTLTDLTANAQYVANVVAHCTNGLTSDESNTVTFETNNIGVEDYLSKAVTLYPNPATEMVSVAVSDANIMITGVEIYNVYGQLINTIVSTENPLRINVSGLADGMYYVRVTTDNGVVTKPFAKK